MAYLAATDITTTLNAGDRHVLGKIKMGIGTLAFGNGALQYPYGGIPAPANGIFGFNKAVSAISLLSPSSIGYSFRYDRTNHKIKIFAQAPLVVFEEVVALTANLTGTTKYPMAWPLYASNGNQALGLLPAGLTPVTTTIAINMHSATPGTRATITAKATDSYSTITISYITQAWKEVFDNLVEAEVMTAGATTTNGITFTASTRDTINFVGQILCGLMVGLQLSTTVSAPKPLFKGETSVAGEYALDWEDTTTKMSVATDQNWNAATASIYFNYIKKPTSGFLYDRFIEEDELTSSSQVATFSSGGRNSIPMLLSTPGFMPGPTVSTTSATWPIGGTGMTLGSTAQWQPTSWHFKDRGVGASTFTSGTGVNASLVVKPTYIYGTPEEVQLVQPLELPNGTVLPSTSIDFMAWGR